MENLDTLAPGDGCEEPKSSKSDGWSKGYGSWHRAGPGLYGTGPADDVRQATGSEKATVAGLGQ